MGGVAGNDIEAICELENDRILIGGGVFGRGYAGVAEISSHTIERQTDSVVKITPNPFVGSFTIEAEIEFEKYEVLNQSGQVVAQGVYKNLIHTELPSGNYILNLFNREGFHSAHNVIKI